MSKRFWRAVGCLTAITTLISACQPAPGEVATESPTATLAASPTPLQPLEPGTCPPLWTFATQGEVWSSPTVRDGTVYFGSDDHFLYAVDITSAQLKWKFETGGLVRSRPAVADGMVYVTSDDNYLYAVDAQTGAEAWRFDLGRNFVQRRPVTESWDYMQSSSAVAGGLIYAGSASTNFYTIDARTGQEKWSFNTFGAVVPTPTIVDGVVYIGSKFPCLYALDAQTGKKKWCFEYPDNAPWVESSAAVANGMVYVGSSDWFRLNAVDAASGELKWYFTTKGAPWSSPTVADGVVYMGTTGGYLYAVDAMTGQELWKVRTGPAPEIVDPLRFDGGVVSSPTVDNGVVYFGSLDGKLYAVSTVP